MSAPLLIFGTSSLARLAHHYLTADSGRHVAAFVVDAAYVADAPSLPAPVISWEEALQRHPAANAEFFVAIGYRVMRLRRDLYDRVAQAGYVMRSIICNAAYVASDVPVGANNFVMPGTVIEPGVTIGDNNVFWSNATICHDSVIGSHNFIAAGSVIGGQCRMGDLNFLGFSATLLHNVMLESETLVGAASLVNRSLAGGRRYFGVPARDEGAIDAASGICVA